MPWTICPPLLITDGPHASIKFVMPCTSYWHFYVYSCQDYSSPHYNWYCIYSNYWLLKLQRGYLGCRQADGTVAISGFLVTTCMALQKVPNMCMVTPVSVFCELVSNGKRTFIVPLHACELWEYLTGNMHCLFSLHTWASLTIKVFHRNMHCSFSLWCMWTVKSHWLPYHWPT